MGSAGSRGSPGRASSGPAAASCGLARHSALPRAACPEPAPLPGDPRSPLESPGPAPRCRGHPRVYSRSHSLAPELSRPRTASGAARLARRQPRSRAYPGVGRAAYGSPDPAAPGSCPACREHCPQESGSTTEAPRPRCTARSLPSGDGAAHKGRLSIVLLPDPEIPSSPPGEANGKGRDEGRRRGEANCPRRRPLPSVSCLPSSPFPKLAFVCACRRSRPAHRPSFPHRNVMGLPHVTSPKNPSEPAKEPLPPSQPPKHPCRACAWDHLLHVPTGEEKTLNCTNARYYVRILSSTSQKRPSF